jgi:hypothetical protein
LEQVFSFSANIALSAEFDPMCTKYRFDPNPFAKFAALVILSASEEGGLQSDHVFSLVASNP